MSFVALDKLNVAGRSVRLGVDYRYPSTQPPGCGSVSSAPSFSPQGPGKPAPEAIAKLFSVFTDQPLQGGQVAPRVFKAVSAQALVFLQFDKNSATEARDLRYIVAAQQFESQGRTITPGVDREFSPTPPPSSC